MQNIVGSSPFEENPELQEYNVILSLLKPLLSFKVFGITGGVPQVVSSNSRYDVHAKTTKSMQVSNWLENICGTW